MRAFAQNWADRTIVQEVLAQISWYHNLALLEKLDKESERIWYAKTAREYGWSHNILKMQIETRAHTRQGKATSNFNATLPADLKSSLPSIEEIERELEKNV